MQRHVNKTFCSCPSKLDSEMLPLRFGFWPVTKYFMESLHISNIIFAQLPIEKSTGSGEFNFFKLTPLKSLSLVLIPGAKLDGHRGTWTGCIKQTISNLKLTPVEYCVKYLLNWIGRKVGLMYLTWILQRRNLLHVYCLKRNLCFIVLTAF